MKLFFALSMAGGLSAGLLGAQPAGPAPMRFSLRPEVLALSNCVARPGDVPLTLTGTNANLEIMGWAAAPSTNRQAGEFLLRFQAPTPVGSVIVYGVPEVMFESGGRWERLEPGNEAGRQLQFLALPPGALVSGIKFMVPALPLARAAGGVERFQATLPFVTLVPIRLANVAREATVTVSSLAPGSQPLALVDGVADARRNFSTGPQGQAVPGLAPDWVMLGWDGRRSFRGLALFRGSEEKGFGEGMIEVFTGAGDPRATRGSEGWVPVTGRSTLAGQFRGNQFFVSREPLDTRAIRFTSTGGVDRVSLGEIAVLRDLGMEPAPGSTRPALAVKSLTVPRVAPGRITVDGRDEDWAGLAGRTNGFALAFDEERLYVLYQVTGDEARFENRGTNLNELFHTGDAVELMLQTRAGLEAQRSGAGRGDVRLVCSVFQGKPVVVLYNFHAEDLLVLPVVFRSGGRTVECDKVSEVKTAQAELRRTPGTLTLELSVPWKELGVSPAALRETRGDFGRISATPPAHRHWADGQAPAPGDLAAGAELSPARWGVLKFGGE